MYLKAVDDGLINLDPGVELLSVDTLPTLVNVSCDFLRDLSICGIVSRTCKDNGDK